MTERAHPIIEEFEFATDFLGYSAPQAIAWITERGGYKPQSVSRRLLNHGLIEGVDRGEQHYYRRTRREEARSLCG